MRNVPSKLAFTAALTLALTFTLSCSGGDDDGTDPNGGISSPSSSPSGGSSGGSSSPSGVGTNKCTDIANCKKQQIGSQYWLAENLNIDVSGSTCYEGKSANCDKYGRLYDWATAMALPSKCNTILSTSDSDCAIKTPNHQGICPSGWHIPSNDDWDRLYRYADGTSGTDSPYNSPTAGRYLKATSGWNDCGPSGSGKSYLCEDTKGFSALPGGSFYYAGNFGYWWSVSEYSSYYAYLRGMYYNLETAHYGNYDKYSLFSVRCVQD